MTLRVLVFLAGFLSTDLAIAQFSSCSCTASVPTGMVNFSTLTWVGTGCPTSLSTSYTGSDLCVNLVNSVGRTW